MFAEIYGLPIVLSDAVPPGRVIVAGRRQGAQRAFMNPLGRFVLTHHGRLPFESRCSIGFRELERDRRRFASPSTPTCRTSSCRRPVGAPGESCPIHTPRKEAPRGA